MKTLRRSDHSALNPQPLLLRLREVAILLGVSEPTGIDLSIGHITGPQGPRSTLDYYEFVERPEVSFEVMVLEDRVPTESWPQIWRYAQENGLGAKRSQGFGRFDVLGWDRRNGATP